MQPGVKSRHHLPALPPCLSLNQAQTDPGPHYKPRPLQAACGRVLAGGSQGSTWWRVRPVSSDATEGHTGQWHITPVPASWCLGLGHQRAGPPRSQACQELPGPTGICLRGKKAGASLPLPKGGTRWTCLSCYISVPSVSEPFSWGRFHSVLEITFDLVLVTGRDSRGPHFEQDHF